VQLGTDPRGTATPGDYSARDGKQATLSGRYAFDSADFAVDLSYRDTGRIGFFDDYSGFGFSTSPTPTPRSGRSRRA
jgi:iron complex outermembrane receptor protein